MAESIPPATDANHPRYQSIETAIARAIESGHYSPGQRLPDERRLAMQFGVSRGTIRQALDRLAGEGRIERHQGRGTFVAASDHRSTYLCAVAVGETARYTAYVAQSLAELEKQARAYGLRLCVRYADDAAGLRRTMIESGQDRTVAVGVVLGQVPPCAIHEWAQRSGKRWVLMADFADERREPPVIDQVVVDWYEIFRVGIETLLQRRVKRPVLCVPGTRWVWIADQISAFRSVCDAAGLPPEDTDVIDLQRYRPAAPTPAEYGQAVKQVWLETIDHWAKRDAWPDALIISGGSLHHWRYCLMQRPEHAERLRRLRLLCWQTTSSADVAGTEVSQWPILWLSAPMAEQVHQALSRLLDRVAQPGQPVRHYMRQPHLYEGDQPPMHPICDPANI